MSQFVINAEVREVTGKEISKKIRAERRFPAIVYGAGQDSISLTVDTREADILLKRMHGEKVLVDLQYGDKSEKVFIRNVQRDPAKGLILHIDFFRVDMKQSLDTRIPVIGHGVPKGVKLGGLLEHGVREIAIRALPGDVPPHIDVNLEDLDMGMSLHVSDLPEMKGVEVTTSGDAVLFSVTAPAAVAASEAASAAEAGPATS